MELPKYYSNKLQTNRFYFKNLHKLYSFFSDLTAMSVQKDLKVKSNEKKTSDKRSNIT